MNIASERKELGMKILVLRTPPLSPPTQPTRPPLLYTQQNASQLLREGFEREVLLCGEEVETNARESLEDIESQGRGCRPGAYGRKLQFADPDFPPDNSSVGNAQCRQQLTSQWKVTQDRAFLVVTCGDSWFTEQWLFERWRSREREVNIRVLLLTHGTMVMHRYSMFFSLGSASLAINQTQSPNNKQLGFF